VTARQLIPAEETAAEIRVANSRFIATIAPAFSVDKARAFIKRMKTEYSDANHNVPAFVVGHGASVTSHSSDDGEPSGTAGRPALTVLQGSGLGDAAVVVTRYFGGTKLGTGGLVRAYGDAVRAVLAAVPKAEKIATNSVEFTVSYSLLDRILILIDEHAGQILGKDFAADVTLTARFRVEDIKAFEAALISASRGKSEIEILEVNPNTIMPLGDG
jgi:uncharacterized YigZ family protein